MNKIIFTLLLLISPLCKAADYQDMEHPDYQFAIAAQSMVAIAHTAQFLNYYRKIYTARALDSIILELNEYDLETIPTNLPGQLQRLWLNHNKIKTVPNDFNHPDLECLYIDNNLIQTITNLNNSPHLQVLSLKNNLITAAGLYNLDHAELRELFLDGNQIETISENINRLEGLYWLFLNNNRIVTLDNLNLLHVGILYLDDNQIETTTNLNAPMLWSLWLRKNSIAALPNNLPNLRNLRLDDNQIETIHENINLPNLRELYLRNNQIEAIDSQVLDQFPNLQWLSLDGNYLPEDNINLLTEYAQGRPNLTITFSEQKKGHTIKPAKR